MNKFLNLAILIVCQISLVACVEFKDVEENTPEIATAEQNVAKGPVPVPVKELEDLVIDQEYFVYGNRIMTEQQIAEEVYKKTRETVFPFVPEAAQNIPLRFKNVTFTSQGRLYLQGNSIQVFANSIRSDGGKILSFRAEDQQARPNKNGLSGGFIRISADTAEGVLEIYLRGQDGANGYNGRSGEVLPWRMCNPEKSAYKSPDYDATSGTSATNGGDSGDIRTNIKSSEGFDLRLMEKRFGKGGRKGLAGIPTTCGIMGAPDYVGRSASDGADGQDGLISQILEVGK